MALAGALVVLWLNEEEDVAREAELSALTALANQAAIPLDVLAPLLQGQQRAKGSEIDYILELQEINRLREA